MGGSCSGSWLSALGSWLLGVLPLLVSLGGGERAVGHQVAIALAPVNSHVRGLLIHLHQGTDLWQDLVGLEPPLDPPAPLLP